MKTSFGYLDNRFLARSVGLLNPEPALVAKEGEVLSNVLSKLKKNKKGCIVVVNEEEEVTGIFSERDVILKLILQEVDLDKCPVCDLMTKEPQTIEMTTTIAFALNLMSEGGFRHLPIVDKDNSALGLLTVKDIIDYISSGLTKDLVEIPD